MNIFTSQNDFYESDNLRIKRKSIQIEDAHEEINILRQSSGGK
jgi:hypothetical protein